MFDDQTLEDVRRQDEDADVFAGDEGRGVRFVFKNPHLAEKIAGLKAGEFSLRGRAVILDDANPAARQDVQMPADIALMIENISG